MDALDQQIANNRASENSGHWFAAHRARVLELLLRIKPTGARRLMALGAGNGNDLDFQALHGEFDEIHLADIDGEALGRAARRHPPLQERGLLHPGLDLREESPNLPKNMDVVASLCLLSQINSSILQTTLDPAESLGAILATRKRHFLLMKNLLRPGGVGLFVSDLVSTDTAPELATAPRESLRALMDHLIAANNFFTGLNPAAVMEMLFTENDFKTGLEHVRFVDPWRWQISDERNYLVYAISFQKRA